MDRVLFSSASAARRLELALERIAAALERGGRVTLVAPTREAGRELVRRIALERGACARVEPTTLTDLSVALARPSLLRRKETWVHGAGLDALVADALREVQPLGRYEASRELPGTPRAIAATLEELALADLSADALLPVDPALAAIASHLESALARRRLVTTATLHARGAKALLAEEIEASTDVVLLDVPLSHALEAELARALVRAARSATITLPHGDVRTRARWAEGLDLAERTDDAGSAAARRLFVGLREEGPLAPPRTPPRTPPPRSEVVPEGAPAPREVRDVVVRSGTTELEECLELVRAILEQLDRRPAIPLERIAIVVRDVERYRVPLGEALARAGLPFHLERGARRADPAGRAFLALLECAAAGLSARAFADYLAFGVLPRADADGAPTPAEERGEGPDADLASSDEADEGIDPAKKARAVIGGALRAPRRWERLLVDAAVIGGGVARWQRRLGGLEEQLRRSLAELEDPNGPEHKRAEANLADLSRLAAFALPLVALLEALPRRAAWSSYVPRLEALARASLLDPRRVLEVLSQLAPVADEAHPDEVSLDDVRRVLGPRLAEITGHPIDRGGAVRVLAADAIAGRAFDLVLCPGLVERAFPRRILEDPILSDRARAAIAPRASDSLDGSPRAPLASSADRAEDERMLLARIAQSAPRLVVSYPRRDERGRTRVPSLYLLELVRADRGVLVSSRALAREGAATEMAPGWPAPASPERAIDRREADLSTIASLLARGPDAELRGRASFLVSSTPILRRALRARHNALSDKWTSPDGLVSNDPSIVLLLAKERLAARTVSPTALESFAACPYRFHLRAIVRLRARETAEAIENLDPMTRGALIHAVQFALVSSAREQGLSFADDQGVLAERLDATLARVAEDARDRLAPAIDSVFDDEIAQMRRDLRVWLHHLAEAARDTAALWTPAFAELGFGDPGGDLHDPHSVPEPIVVSVPRAESGEPLSMRLRGSIDLVERGPSALRATDYKTGKAQVKQGARIGGGEALQPLLYALVLEAMLARGLLPTELPAPHARGGRLWYCTARGEHRSVEIALDDEGRRAVGRVASAIERSLERPFLPRAPRPEACARCDYLAVCGPDAAERAAKKAGDRRLEALEAVRSEP